ncbi:MAG: hypothetical protein DSY80_10620 [Desulfocapsa sp.]|nr:MAG: hypothetical protein DSY80_10620 [Desulfocapsa sp.]
MLNWKYGDIDLKVNESLTQKDVEDWSSLLPDVKDVSISKWRGDVVRAAVKAKWFTPELDVDAMSPADVVWLADKIVEYYKEITSPVSPN